MTTPEDIITEEGEEISEQNFAQDETDAFDSANVEEAEKPKPEKARGKSKAQAPAPPKEDEPEPSADAKPGDGDADAKPAKPDDKKPDEELTTRQLAERIALEEMAKMGVEPSPEQPPPDRKRTEPESPPADEQKDRKPTAAGKVDLASIIKSLPEKIDLGDGNIVNLKEYAADFPDDFNAALILSQTIAQQMIDQAMGAGKILSTDKLQEFEAKVENLRFDAGLSKSHSDWEEVINSDDFTGWLENQPAHIQGLIFSNNVRAAKALLDTFKEETASFKAREFDKKAMAKKQAHNDLHKSTMRSSSQSAKERTQMDDEKAGFDEFDESKY